MPLSSFPRLLVCILIIPFLSWIAGSEDFTASRLEKGVEYSGLTRTIVSLLKTRTPGSIVIGSNEFSVEDLFSTDIASIFDCDSVISSYLTEAGENASYGILSDALRNSIMDRIKEEDGDMFVHISSDTIPGGMFFNFYVNICKPVTIPVMLAASDSSFSTSFDTICTAEFETDLDLFIDAGMVNSGKEKDGLSIRINRFSFELTSDPEAGDLAYENGCQDDESGGTFDFTGEPEMVFPFFIEGNQFTATARCLSLYAKSYWYLSPEEENSFDIDEGESYTLTYGQLEKGDFQWDDVNLSSFRADLALMPAGEKWDSQSFAGKGNEFSYWADDLFSDDGNEQVYLCCNFEVSGLVTVRKSKNDPNK